MITKVNLQNDKNFKFKNNLNKVKSYRFSKKLSIIKIRHMLVNYHHKRRKLFKEESDCYHLKRKDNS